MLNILNTANRAPGECIVSIDDAEIADLYPFLLEVMVDTSREAAAEATLKFESRRDESGTWTVHDDDRIRPWRKLRVDAAFGEFTEEVMRGYIREVQVEMPQDSGSATVTVKVQDESLALDREHKRRPWGADVPYTDAQIVTEVIAEHSLIPEDGPAEGQTNLELNQDDTDIKFLRKRADTNGYELIFREGAVYFGPMRLDGEPQNTIMVYAGTSTNCISFSVADDGHQPDQVTYELAAETGADTVAQTVQPNLTVLGNEPASSTATLDDRFAWRVSQQGISDEGQMEQLAQQQANQTSMKISASGALDGTLYGHVLKVGLTVGVDGVGERYGGVWYVDTVNHKFDPDGYQQEFAILRNAYGDNLSVSTSPLAAVL